jgi:CRISPR-associated endonuclease Csn1
MAKTILGLDLGTTSIGWAIVKEGEKSEIIKTGVRVIPLSIDEIQNFDKGKSITTNADRTLKRSARKNLQRYKLRRTHLIKALLDSKIISSDALLNEHGNSTTFETYRLRSKAAKSKVELDELARILLMINKKRGYKSSRKAKGEDEGSAIDGMAIAMRLYNDKLTPGQLVHLRFSESKMSIPDFYRSDLQHEFDAIWKFQQKFNKDILTNELYDEIVGKTKTITASIFRKKGYDGVELKGTLKDKKIERYKIRSKAISEQCSINELSEILPEINNNINSSSGYLGAISDRSKELYFNKQTVGQFQYDQIKVNPHHSLRNQVFYRQDYLDEFNQIWEVQNQFYPTILTEELKHEIRDIIIFFQRRLKSQKGLLSICEFEGEKKIVLIDGKEKEKVIGPKVCPKSSPLFQEFKIWAQLNNIEYKIENDKSKTGISLELDQMETLFSELNWKEKMSSTEVLKLLGIKGCKLNFEFIEGNRTNAGLIEVLEEFFEKEGHDNLALKKLNKKELFNALLPLLEIYGINKSILEFDNSIEGKGFETQLAYNFWHLLYSFEGDNSQSGIEKLRQALTNKFDFPYESNTVITNIKLQDDYSSLSTKAIRKILPHLKEGNRYDLACLLAGYNHSHSETKKDLDDKILKDVIAILPKNSLRNPVVEKILNQMINVVNEIIEHYGKPDEIRVEMARDLKKSAKEREETTRHIRKSTDEHNKYRQILRTEFGLPSVSKNDLIRYKLYLELEKNGFKTLYSNTYIEKEKLFSSDFDIEHIIPQSRLFDDSFSNKTLELRSVNLKKGSATAYDFISDEYGENGLKQYEQRVNVVFPFVQGTKSKHNKLLMSQEKIPTNFIERDLRDTAYIAKKAREILLEVVRTVNTTTGMITDRLRKDWQLVDVLQELNWDKYDALGLTFEKENRHGQKIKHIKDWTKRNDHRHHAMDALTVAFTKPSIVQYLNNLNAKSDKSSIIFKIQEKETYFDKEQKRRFNPPIPIDDFRQSAKEHLEKTLVSFKAKNKVSTKNKNSTTTKLGKKTTISETPRGQLHLETVYGSSKEYAVKYEKVNASFTEEKINLVANQKHKNLLLERLTTYNGDAKKAFTGANSLAKKPIYLNALQTYTLPETVKLVTVESRFTIRKPITPELKIDKVIDKGAQRILQARLEEYGNDAKKAFSNLVENPIYLNKEKGIVLKTVTISGVSNAVSLHSKRDHFGKVILDGSGKEIPIDFVNTGNNHHVAIYRDEKGNLQEEIVSLFEAITRKNQNLSVINKKHENGWEFLFTMKQNEFFVFPNEKTGFDPNEVDLLDEDNYKKISPNLFRVQKISSKNYMFNHHLETEAISGETLKNEKILSTIKYHFIRTPSNLSKILKVRLNHLGQIIQVGEY